MVATEVTKLYKGWNWHFSPCTKDSRGLRKMVSQGPKADPMLKTTLILTDISSVIFQERPSKGATACGGHKRRLCSDLSTPGSAAQDSRQEAFGFVLYPEAGLWGTGLSTAPGRGCPGSSNTKGFHTEAFNQEGCVCSYLPQTAPSHLSQVKRACRATITSVVTPLS